MNGSRPMRVLGIHTPLLGNRTYSENLREAFEGSPTISYDARWSTEERDAHREGRLERQLERVFLKMVERPFVRRRHLDFFVPRYEIGTSYWGRRTLNKHLRSQQPDLLHLHTQNVALLAPDVMRRVPTVVSVDGSSYLTAELTVDPPWRWTFAPSHALERLALRTASAVVPFSQWAATSIIEEHGVAPERVHVIPPGADIERFDRAYAEATRSERRRRILFVGGQFARKGGPLLVDLFLERFAHRGDVELHIVTHDPVDVAHPLVFVHRGVRAHSSEWFERYVSSDVFVMPTSFDQAPLVYVEAMAARLPIVTTPVGAAAEIVRDGETGYIVRRNDLELLTSRLTAILDDASLRERLGTAAHRRAATHYSTRSNVAKLERLFLDIGRPAAERAS